MELAEGVWYAAPRDPRNRHGHALRGHLYWGKTYDLPYDGFVRGWGSGFFELNIGRYHIGICR